MKNLKDKKEKAKARCKLIGCSGMRKECLEGDFNCSILKPFLNLNKI